MHTISEQDWKKLRAMKDELLHVSCEKIFDGIQTLMDQRDENSHKVYLALWKLLRKEDKEISLMFDDLKRSNAFLKLAALKCFSHNLPPLVF